MAKWLHLALFAGLLLLVGGEGIFPELAGHLQPNNPVVKLGDTLVLRCVMHPVDNRSSSELIFVVRSLYLTHEDEAYVTVLDNVTSELRLPATEDLNQELVMCNLLTPGTTQSTIVGMQIVTVILPLPVTDVTQCIVRHSSMRCEWSPTESHHTLLVKKRVVHVFKWRLKGEPAESWRDCPEEDIGVCVWPQSKFIADAVYLIHIQAGYKQGFHNVTSNFTINSAHFVQVDPVDAQTLSVRHLRPGTVQLVWSAVPASMPVIYRVNVTHPSPQHRPQSLLRASNEVILQGLTPYQRYDLSLEAKTSGYGYWSEPITPQIFAMAAVPARNPEVRPGGFSVKEVAGDLCVEITMYWKLLAGWEQHGPEFHYDVEVVNAGNCGRECTSRAQTLSHVTVVVPQNCTTELTVTSVNANGSSAAPRTPVRIEPAASRIPGPSNITVITSADVNTVTVGWNEEEEEEREGEGDTPATTGYTVYWCSRLTFPCDDELNWRAVAAGVHQVVLQLAEAFGKYQFAVSREEGGRTSGMVLGNCIYQQDQYSPPPHEFVVSETTEAGHGELALEWRAPQCHTHRGFVYGYLLTYCVASRPPAACRSRDRTTRLLSGAHTGFLLTGLTEHALYCVTISSMTVKGPSEPSPLQCSMVTGSWWMPGRIIGVTIGCVLALTLVIFGIIRFGSKCHKIYSKFQRGLRVELPHTSYSTQFSVSSARDLIDTNHSLDDYSSGLAKQHSQESTADSGRGSMTHDHSQPIRRSTSGESDEVFLGKNIPFANGSTTRTRQLSEPMSSYACIMHNSRPDGHSTSTVSLGTPVSTSKPKLPPANRTPPKDGSLGSAATHGPHGYNMSSPGSIPNYVMVGGNSQPCEEYSLNDSSCGASQISDYTRANGENSSLHYRKPGDQNNQNISAPLGYVTIPETTNQGSPLGYVTVPEAANKGAHLGYVTIPEASIQGAPLGYVTVPETVNQGAPLGYVTVPEVANQGAPLGYVTVPEAANQGAPLGYATVPKAANQGASLGYVTVPEAANQGAPLGYVTAPEANNRCVPLGYVTLPEASNQGAPLEYVTPAEAANQGAPLGYVTAPELANQEIPIKNMASPKEANPRMSLEKKLANHRGSLEYLTTPETANQDAKQKCSLGYVTAPETANYLTPNGYVTAPDTTNQVAPDGYVIHPELAKGATDSNVVDEGRASPSGYVVSTEVGNGVCTNTNGSISNSKPGIDGHVPLANSGLANSSDYVKSEDAASPLAVFIPLFTSDDNRSPIDRQSAEAKQQRNLYQPYSSLSSSPIDLKSSSNDMASISPHKELSGWNNDANHNDVTNSGSYVWPPDMTSPLDNIQNQSPEDGDETCSLLPSDGGRKVLNKSGYVVIDT